MTTHYKGVQYWTELDTVRSLQLDADEREALDVVRNVTNAQVHCDAFDERYHTHPRSAVDPAPDAERLGVTSLPMCMYGRCTAPSSSNCDLNLAFLADLGLTPASTDWYRNSAYVEYDGTAVLRHHVVSLEVSSGRAVGVWVSDGTQTSLTCARHAVLLAGGVMGNAPLLLPHIGAYKFFAQPVLVYMDPEVVARQVVCDDGSLGGGTFHGMREGTGFLSTFGMCTVGGSKRLVWATPQAINPAVEGVLSLADGVAVATVNFDDPAIVSQLRLDVARAANETWGMAVHLDGVEIEYAAYHWSGDASIVHRSAIRGVRSLYAADAFGIVGTTSGWTSFNARVSGAVAALRALRYKDNPCASVRREYESDGCCQQPSSASCASVYSDYHTYHACC
jgi:hypothetical protein